MTQPPFDMKRLATKLTAPRRKLLLQEMEERLKPTRRCLVCNSPKRAEVEDAWAKGTVNEREIADRLGVSPSTVYSHFRKGHPGETLGAVFKETADLRSLAESIPAWIEELSTLFDEARGRTGERCDKCGQGAMDNDIALKAAQQIGQFLERMGKVTGEIKHDTTTVNVLVGSEQAARMVGAADELELAEEYERRAGLLRARHAEKLALEARAVVDAEFTAVEAVVVPAEVAPSEPGGTP